MRILDRYVIREVLPPFFIALVVFTFILIIPFIIEIAEQLIAKGVAGPTILRIAATLLPQALGLTIPMALLIGLLVGFGRLSADREIVVMMACGVSQYRLLRPALLLAVIAWAATSWVMIESIPNANQTYREITARIMADRAEDQVRAREFFEDFPGVVLYVRERAPEGGWTEVLAADTKNPAHPVIFLAENARMIVDRASRSIQMVLLDGTMHTTNASDATQYSVERFSYKAISLDPETVFPRKGPAPGDREKSIAELREDIAANEARGLPTHNQIMEIHKKFSIPIACLVFGLAGVALGVSNRRDNKLASFVLGIGVIFAYYIIMYTGTAMTKGALIPPWLTMWIPNIVLGAAGLAVLRSRGRGSDRPLRLRLPFLTRREREGDGATAAGAALEPRSTAVSPDAESRRKQQAVLVIRIPPLQLPRPRLLDIYIAKTYLRILGMTTVGMAGLFYISTFMDLSDKWFKGQVTLTMLLQYLAWETPQFLYYILAIAVLLSALVTIGLLTKNSELIVMRACGISLYRTALPLVLFAIVASGILFAFEERVLAFSNRRADYLKHIIRGGSPQTFDVLMNRKWIVGKNGEIYHYQFFDPRRQELNVLSVFEFDPKTHDVVRRVYATQAAYAPRAGNDTTPWIARSGWLREFKTGVVSRYATFDLTRLALETADYFVTEAPEPERMTAATLSRYIDELMASGYNVLEYQVALQRKYAFPLVTIVMTLIAVPFAVTTGKRGAMYGIGIGIGLALVYWTLISVFAALGAGGLVPPVLAAWAPNLLFGASAAYMLLTVRT